MKKVLNRWIYVISGTIALIFSGLVYAWTTLAGPISAHFPEWNEAQISLTFTIVMLGFCAGSFLGSFLLKRMKPMMLMFISAVLFLIGFLLTSFAGSLFILYLGFGAFGGIGSGLSYNAVMTAVLKWFPDKQGLCSGILLMGFGIGAFLIGKVYTAFTPSDGSETWRTSFLIFGIILLVIMAVTGLFTVLPPAEWQAPAPLKAKKRVTCYEDVKSNVMLRRANFWLYFFWTACVSSAGLMIISQGRPIALETMQLTTLSATAAQMGSIATIVGLISIFNAVGRLIFGYLYDIIGRFLEMLIGCVVFVIGLLLIVFALNSHSEGLLIVAYIVTGLAYGCVNPTNSSFVRQYYGTENYSMNLSFINMVLLIASFSSTIAGAVYDSSGSYLTVIFICLGLIAAGIILNFLIRTPKQK